ncbi:hypothetical protein RUM44_006524 [Polyplax serrata]|uniref:Uncharacterized protein n=1 Tax=Polyplax serrata TaxID=468196 RepID=A0ABR1AID3_POLSC
MVCVARGSHSHPKKLSNKIRFRFGLKDLICESSDESHNTRRISSFKSEELQVYFPVFKVYVLQVLVHAGDKGDIQGTNTDDSAPKVQGVAANKNHEIENL